jgi:hypothetical protein
MTKDFNMIEYLEGFQKKTIDNIQKIAEDGTEKDAVKLKANQVLLNKLLPDRTKMDLDIHNMSPYEFWKKKVGDELSDKS